MNLKISQKNLSKAVNIAEKAVSSKNIRQSLNCFHMTAKENKLIIRAMNTDLAIETSKECSVKTEGTVLVNAALFGDIIRKISESDVEILFKDNTLEINSGKTRFRLSTESDEDFPKFPSIDKGTDFTIKSNDLKRAVQNTVISIVEDNQRPTLRGILFELTENLINFVSLDGYRLSSVSYEKSFDFSESFIVPGNSAKDLIKILPDDGDVSITATEDGMFFVFEETVFFTKLIAGNYFDYHSLIKEKSDINVLVNLNELKLSLERAVILKRDGEMQGVVMTFNNNELIFDMLTEIGDFHDAVPIEGDGGGLKIKFNTRYVLQGLSQFQDEKVRLSLDGGLKPMVIRSTGSNSFLYLVLPTRM